MTQQIDKVTWLAEPADDDLGSSSPPEVHRPVQYLGSKLRVLPMLRKIIAEGGSEQGVVWDAFTGSSVVAQAIAADGNQVFASDTLASSVTFAKAALGVERGEECAEDQLHLILQVSKQDLDFHAWRPFLRLEQEYVTAGDGASLLVAEAELPQRWRRTSGDAALPPDLKAAFDFVDDMAARRAPSSAGLISATYAGTYFGLRQALRLDALRGAINSLASTQQITPWVSHVALTALCTAASKAVFSAGKHFAQPHKVHNGKDLSFHAKRIVQDRRVDIDVVFAQAFHAVVASSRPSSEGHGASVMQTEAATVEDLTRRGVKTVYADPPYTAQQYSRFYHLLETLVSGIPPKLQQFRGAVTSGLYPEDRYKSPFCSRLRAPAAFQHLITTSAAAGARLVLSYSGSSEGSRGNARTVAMDFLVEIVEKAYGAPNVKVLPANVRYRQFNHSSAEVAGRDDPEYVIVGEVSAR